jgi:hypothetical protein
MGATSCERQSWRLTASVLWMRKHRHDPDTA